MAHRTSNHYRRFTTSLLGTLVGLVALSFALNTWIDPLWVTPAPWTDRAFDDYKPIHKQPRTGKAGIAMRGDWDAVIVGSSRLDIAIDPRDPAWDGANVANLGLRGGNLCEFEPMVSLATKHNDLKTVLLGVDHYDLTSPIIIPNPGAFFESPLAPAASPLDRVLRYHIGGSSTAYSIKSLNYRRQDRLASYDHLGQWVESLDGRPFRAIFLTDSLPQALNWIKHSNHSNAIVDEKIAALDSILKMSAENDFRLIIFIPPNHGAYLSVFFEEDSIDPTFDTNRRALLSRVAERNKAYPDAQPVEVWDFCDFHPLNCEALTPVGEKAKMSHWIDGTHATSQVGHVMLSRALTEDGPEDSELKSYGVRLSEGMLDQRSAQIEEGAARYRQDHPLDLEWLRTQLDESSSDSEKDAQHQGL